jgi:hypothetical protein
MGWPVWRLSQAAVYLGTRPRSDAPARLCASVLTPSAPRRILGLPRTGDPAMSNSKLQKIVDDIANAPAGADIKSMMAPLSASDKKEVARLLDAAATRLEREAQHHAAWAERERAKGRPEDELTWGNCLRETGILYRDALKVQ